MLAELDRILKQALKALETIQDETGLEIWRVAYLGRSAPLMPIFDQLGKLSKAERPAVGRRANEVKLALEAAYSTRLDALRQSSLQHSLQSERLDVTLPGRDFPIGRLHPATISMRRVIRAFADMGFQVYRSPEAETDEYNFGLLKYATKPPCAGYV